MNSQLTGLEVRKFCDVGGGQRGSRHQNLADSARLEKIPVAGDYFLRIPVLVSPPVAVAVTNTAVVFDYMYLVLIYAAVRGCTSSYPRPPR